MGAGRPSEIRKLRQKIKLRDGSTITVQDRVVQLLEVGNYLEAALRQVGLSKSAAYRWFDLAARAAAARDAGTGYRPTTDERAAIGWRDAVWDAEARGQSHLLGILERESRGGYQVETVTEKWATGDDGEQRLVERVVKSETARPDTATIRWRLERRFPELWGRQRIEVTGPDGGEVAVSVNERASQLAEALGRLASAQEPAASTNGHGS